MKVFPFFHELTIPVALCPNGTEIDCSGVLLPLQHVRELIHMTTNESIFTREQMRAVLPETIFFHNRKMTKWK